jgi:SseB protein C-terminal domain
MKFISPFSSKRRTQGIDVPVLTFIGEQDGPPERLLKGELSELFSGHKNVLAAYLTRVHYADPTNVSVCLCLSATNGVDEPLVEAVHTLFARRFNREVCLDIIFLRSSQKVELDAVCRPFYQCN